MDNIGMSSRPAALCRGSWMLGTACGHCERCHDEAARVIPTLLLDRARLARITALVPAKPNYEPNADISEGLQATLFREIRSVVHNP